MQGQENMYKIHGNTRSKPARIKKQSLPPVEDNTARGRPTSSARIREKVEGGISSKKGSREVRIFFPIPPSTFLSPHEGGDNKSRGGMTIV